MFGLISVGLYSQNGIKISCCRVIAGYKMTLLMHHSTWMEIQNGAGFVQVLNINKSHTLDSCIFYELPTIYHKDL